MQVKKYAPAAISGRELIMEGKDMRVQILTLDKGESIPWHFHSEITDYFVCLEESLSLKRKHQVTNTCLKSGNGVRLGP